MAVQHKPRVGRRGIELLKDRYNLGTDATFDVQAAIDYLNAEGIAKKHLRYGRVRDWLRQAALEVQATGTVSVTNPVLANGYTRSSTPSPAERRVARESRRKDTRTRVVNDGIESSADAKRPDATPAERAIPKLYESMESMLDAIKELSSA